MEIRDFLGFIVLFSSTSFNDTKIFCPTWYFLISRLLDITDLFTPFILANIKINFDSPHLSWLLEFVRAFELACIVFLSFYLIWKLIRTFEV